MIKVVLALVVSATPALADVRITGDAGGRLDVYQQRVETIRRSGERVIIDGFCNSACTLVLTLPASQLCVTPRASFTFHAVHDARTGMPLSGDETYRLWKLYPPRVQLAIGKRGGLNWVPVTVPGREVASPCR